MHPQGAPAAMCSVYFHVLCISVVTMLQTVLFYLSVVYYRDDRIVLCLFIMLQWHALLIGAVLLFYNFHPTMAHALYIRMGFYLHVKRQPYKATE